MVVFVEGNIGVGKSTFLNLLNANGVETLQEPVETWTSVTNDNGKNILEEFYADPVRHSYTFQSIAFRSRVSGLSSVSKNCIVERSVFTDRMVFAQVAREAGNISNIEWNDYVSWFDFIVDVKNIKPAGFIYLRASPETCVERIKKRSRPGEETIPIEYIKRIHDKHDLWLSSEDNVITFNMDKNRPEDIIQDVLEFIKTTNI